MSKVIFKSRKEASEFLKEKGIDTSNWTEEKWQSINKSQAEIHIQALAESMWDEYNESTPKELKEGKWHIPFGDNIQESGLHGTVWTKLISPEKKDLEFCKVKIATARCARLSYMTFDGEIDYEKDIKLHDHLLESGHMSPFEHCTQVPSQDEYDTSLKGKEKGWFRNYKGFKSYRQILEEC